MPQDIKINLGCGRAVLTGDGWVNFDNSPSVLLSRWAVLKAALFRLRVISRVAYETTWPPGVVWRDVARGLPFPDRSVAKIYSQQMLEHLEKARGEFLLRECFRVLKSGGILRLVVPDLVCHARRYLEHIAAGEAAGREPHDDFLRNIYGAYLQRKRYGACHRYMYDWPTLWVVLKSTGFREVWRQENKVCLDPEMALLDASPTDSLHVDAVK